MNEKNNYDDIMVIPRPVSSKHKPMDRINRAAQFAPFAALTGYGAAINETGRIVDEKKILSQSEIDLINSKLQYLSAHPEEEITVSVVYFVPDKYKSGGAYKKISGVIRNVYPNEDIIEFQDRSKIRISDIKTLVAPEIDFLEDTVW